MSGRPFILFITGTSASGKTTLYESLKKDEALQHIHFHDMDEAGVPQVGRDLWRRFRVEELLYNAIQELSKGNSTVICGIAKPHEIIESLYYKHQYAIYFLLLDAQFGTVRQRLRKRVDAQATKGTYDESFSKSSWDMLISGNKELKRVLHNTTFNQKNGHIINVSGLSRESMHNEARALINNISASTVRVRK